MIAIARLADRSPTSAAAVAASLLLAAFVLFPVVGVFMVVPVTLSAATVAFVILRRGERAALRAGLICFVMLLAVSAIMLRSALAIPVAALSSWLPPVAVALVLARTSSLALATLAAVALGMLAVLAFTLVTGDPAAWWRTEIERMLGALTDAGRAGGVDVAAATEAIAPIAFWLTGALGASIALSALVALFIARHWQAVLVNPGGFATEFRALSLGRGAALGTLALVAAAATLGGPLLVGLAIVACFGFVLQGLAILHALVARHALPAFWLYAIYALLVMVPYLWPLLLALGLLDNRVPLRRG